LVATITPLSVLLATVLAPIDTDISNLITRVIIRVGTLATLTPKGIVISAHLAISTITLYISTTFFIIKVVATLTIDTTVRT
jgi:hypothetical protein